VRQHPPISSLRRCGFFPTLQRATFRSKSFYIKLPISVKRRRDVGDFLNEAAGLLRIDMTLIAHEKSP